MATQAKTTAKKATASPPPAGKHISRDKEKAEEQKLRLRVAAYENKILDSSTKQIVDTALRYGAVVRGPIPLPTNIKKYTVNRGAFVHKNAREQFEMRVHRRMIDIMNPSQKIVEALTNLNLPSGVNVDVKMS
jgi:small subunit ribosomal protein S10